MDECKPLPPGVRLVMEVACIFFQHAPKMMNDPSPTAKPGAKAGAYTRPPFDST